MRTQPTQSSPTTFILFGATGDLAKRKLFPALFRLFQRGSLGEQFSVIGVARKSFPTEEFRKHVHQSLEEFGHLSNSDAKLWETFAAHLDYVGLDITQKENYTSLNSLVSQVETKFNIPGNRIFYLAIAPNLFGPVALNLKSADLLETQGFKRLVIEKPFGHDYASAEALNNEIRKVFSEEEIYRIDHYLGKEMVQNIEVIRFANSIFEPLWNNKHIANVQITSSETVGVEERSGYYEKAGALRDMVQNHMLQMVMMTAMEPPSRLVTEAIRDEKVKVLRSLRRYSGEEVDKHVIRGQYTSGTINDKSLPAYVEEKGVNPKSTTETFIAAKLYIDNFRWAGVPFYIRTGKRMPVKSTEIIIQFKDLPKNLYFNKRGELGSNLLGIRIHPKEGIYLQLNAKKPGTEGDVTPITMDFCQNCEVGINLPEAYERLLLDCLEGDSTFFTRWDEVALAWKFVDPIAESWAKGNTELYPYVAGSWGPESARQLLQLDFADWWPVYGNENEIKPKAQAQAQAKELVLQV